MRKFWKGSFREGILGREFMGGSLREGVLAREFYDTRNQSGSFALVNAGSGLSPSAAYNSFFESRIESITH